MRSSKLSNRLQPTAIDLLLVVLAVVGYASYAILLPENHPDSTAEYGLHEQEVVDKSNIFLANQGYSIENLEVEARLTRNVDLLREMQEDLGRTRTIAVLGAGEASTLPAYFWSVSYELEDSEGRENVFTVKLTQGGTPWALINNLQVVNATRTRVVDASREVHKRALGRIFAPHDTLVAATVNRIRAIPDSLIRTNLSFAESGSSERSGADQSDLMNRVLESLESAESVLLDSTYIISLAEYYAPSFFLRGSEWVVDSLRVADGRTGQIAELRLKSVDAIDLQNLRVDITVSSRGTLEEMDIVFNPDQPPSNITQYTLYASVGAVVLLAIILIITFFQRMIAKLIDVKSAMLDALLIGLVFGTYAILTNGIISGATSLLWSAVLMLFVFSVTAGAMALFVFIVSAATDSITREAWPEKLMSLTLSRAGDFLNTLVGTAILRGAAIAGILLGIGVIALVVYPELSIELNENLLSDVSFRPVIWSTVGNFGKGFLISLGLLLGIGAFANRVGGHAWVVVICVTLSGCIFHISPFDLHSGWLTIGLSGTAAFVLVLAFLRYDFLTAFVGFFLASLIWQLSEGFLIADSPAFIDSLLMLLILSAMLVVGFVGVTNSRAGDDIEIYVPEYLTEMAGQERNKRELEIAQQVQASFLPRAMPYIQGLDLAGMCLPASEVGGDYFDFIELSPSRVAFVVGDVSGKGIQAAFYMTFVKGVIQTLSRMIDSPAEVMRRLNLLFRKNAPVGTFISMIYGVVDVTSGTFTFARAGHNPAILMRAKLEKAEALRPTGMAIGFADGEVFDTNIDEVYLEMLPGDSLVFYTDGFSEAMNSDRELYGDDRLVDKVSQVGHRSASAILRSLTEDVHHFIEVAGRNDDMTMVVIKMLSRS